MSKGIVLFGVNNTRVDYVMLAVIAATFIKRNMPGTDICLITDLASKQWHEQKNKDYPLSRYFSDIQLLPSTPEKFENIRAYRDTRYYHVDSKFRNESRSRVYDMSPFDETLLLDTDYLICNNVFNTVWGSVEDVMINKRAVDLLHRPLKTTEDRLNPFGIKMYWATAIYFKKSEKAEMLFNLVEHIKDNWEFYKLTYDFPGTLFRNDYAFSIAIHILNGFEEGDEYFKSLPDDSILSALDIDQLYDIHSPTELSLFMNDRENTWKFYATRTKGLNVHCMNKLSILNNKEKIMGVLSE